MSDILSSFGKGYQLGNVLRTSFEQRDLRQQQALQMEQQAARQQQIMDMYDKLQTGNATAEDYLNLAAILPEEQSKPVREAFQLMTEEQQRGALNDTGKIFAAFRAGQPSIAVNMMQQQAKAMENSGEKEAAELYRTWADLAQASPEGAKAAENYFGFTISQIPGGTDVIDNAINLFGEEREAEKHEAELNQMGAELGLTQEQIEETKAKTEKLGAETRKILMELEAKDQITPEEKFSQERQIRQEYQGRIKDFNEAINSYARLKASADDPTGAGDVALITSFMKMLDPGSVVRESEFATAQDTAGLFGRLGAILERVKTGERLTEQQRQSFVGLAGKYMQSAEKYEERVREDLGNVVEDYGLDYDNVFGTTVQDTDISELRKFVKRSNPDTTANVDSLTEDQIIRMFPNTYQAYSDTRTIEVDY